MRLFLAPAINLAAEYDVREAAVTARIECVCWITRLNHGIWNRSSPIGYRLCWNGMLEFRFAAHQPERGRKVDRPCPDALHWRRESVMPSVKPERISDEVASRIRLHPWGKRVTLIALTGWGQARDMALHGRRGSITT